MKSERHVFLALMVAALLSCLAWGHVVVYPERVAPGAFERFVLRVPTEKPIPTTRVRLLIPDNLQVFSLGGKAGWRYEIEKDSSGRLKSITWSGGAVPAGEFTDFEFVARAPREPTSLVWKAYQTYQDGSVVAWVGPPDAREPASITKVELPAKTGSPPAWVNWSAFALALVAVLLSLYSVFRHD
jgi:uncharacterized protein YcnI